MALIATQSITRAGLNVTYTAVSTADTFLPGRNVWLHFKNTNAATRDIVVVAPGEAIAGVAYGDVARTIAATTGDVMIGPFPSDRFADPTDGLADYTVTAAAGVTVACLDLSQP
jgi:hypothetical protein